MDVLITGRRHVSKDTALFEITALLMLRIQIDGNGCKENLKGPCCVLYEVTTSHFPSFQSMAMFQDD